MKKILFSMGAIIGFTLTSQAAPTVVLGTFTVVAATPEVFVVK